MGRRVWETRGPAAGFAADSAGGGKVGAAGRRALPLRLPGRRFPGCSAAVPRESGCMEFAEVACPTCGEVFEVAVPPPAELPTELDYDCEVCCRPMVIVFTGEEVYAKGLAE